MQSNLSLYSVLAFVALDTDGNRVFAKYYKPKHSPHQFVDAKPLSTLKEQRAYEKSLWEKTKKAGGAYTNTSPARVLTCARTGDIILYDGLLAVYKHSLDIIFYVLALPVENELMLSVALTAYSDAISLLLRGQVERRALMDNLDLALLALDETIDDGCVCLRQLVACARRRMPGSSSRRTRLRSRPVSADHAPTRAKSSSTSKPS